MRTFIAAMLIVVLPHSILAGESCTSGGKILDEKSGFRDIKFGTTVQNIPDLKQVPQDLDKTKRVKAYARNTDTLAIFDQPLTAITYFFFDDRLFCVELKWLPTKSMGILQGFGDAFGCKLDQRDGATGQDLSLSIVGEIAKFYAFVHIERFATLGVAYFQKRGIQQAIDDAIKNEAASQF